MYGMDGFLQAHFAMIPPLRTRLLYCLLLFCHLPFGFGTHEGKLDIEESTQRPIEHLQLAI